MVEATGNEEQMSEAERALARQRLALTLKAAAFGEVVSLLMRSKAHSALPISELGTLVAPAIVHEQYLVAKKTEKDEPQNSMLIGVVMWASVSNEIDADIRNNPEKPIRLQMAEWKSGPHNWVVDLIAADAAKGALLRDVQKRFGETPVNVRVADADGGAPAIRLLNDLLSANQS